MMQTTHAKGRILRVKHGYNPNSSSMGSIIFALPVSLMGLTAGFALISSLILPRVMQDRSAPRDEGGQRPADPERP